MKQQTEDLIKNRILFDLREEIFPSSKDLRWIVKNIPKDCKNILDAGCGEFHPFYLANELSQSYITGIDTDKNIILKNKQFLIETPLKNICFIQGDILKLNSKNQVYNCIVSSRVFHYIENKNYLFKKFFNILKCKGYLIITEFCQIRTLTTWSKIKDRLHNWWCYEPTRFHSTKDEIISSAENNGFKLIGEQALDCFCGKERQVFGLKFQKIRSIK